MIARGERPRAPGRPDAAGRMTLDRGSGAGAGTGAAGAAYLPLSHGVGRAPGATYADKTVPEVNAPAPLLWRCNGADERQRRGGRPPRVGS